MTIFYDWLAEPTASSGISASVNATAANATIAAVATATQPGGLGLGAGFAPIAATPIASYANASATGLATIGPISVAPAIDPWSGDFSTAFGPFANSYASGAIGLATIGPIQATGSLYSSGATGLATIGPISAFGQASFITTYVGGAAGAGYSTGYGGSGGGGGAGPKGAGSPGGASQNNATASGGSGGGAAEGGGTGQIAAGASGGAGGSAIDGTPGGAGSSTGAGNPGGHGSGAGGGSDLGAGATGGGGDDWTLPDGTTVGAGGGGSAGGGQGSQAATVPGGAGGAFGGGGGAGGTDSTTAYAGGQGGQGGIVLAYFPASFGSVTGSLITNAAPATVSSLSAPPITAYLSQTTVSATLSSSAVIANITAGLNATSAAATLSATATASVTGQLTATVANSVLVSNASVTGAGIAPPISTAAIVQALIAAGPTTLTQTIPAYIYAQYSDDEDIQALFTAYNTATQEFIDWFNTIQLPVYTGSQIQGPLLDWVAGGLYGISRPQLVSGSISAVGPLNTWALNTIALNAFKVTGQINRYTVNDDIFKRIITWHFFKGDGQQFCTEWLKRRVMRFLVGRNGAAPNIDNTYPVSVAFNGNGSVTVNVSVDGFQVTADVAQIFQAGISSGKLAIPFQLSTTVKTNQVTTGLANDGDVLQITNSAGWPTSPGGLAPGALWDNSGVASVITGYTVSGAPLFYGNVTSAQLLADGGKNLPTSNPNVTGELWNDNGVVSVS